ncbi:MAG TPA: ABC transporter ATP-binding protein [Candidatus Thermoplasmatota archaeon]|nr:ABC transporter ATP-binding protein [Candidatus Thermoplasmatota archaeon]
MRAPAVVAENLSKSYDGTGSPVPVLRGVSLSVAPGEFVAVTGPSGCGKTTLLNCLSGLDAPTSGRALLSGHDLAALSDDERTRLRGRKVGFVFQSYNLLPVLSAVENVELPLLIAGQAETQARAEALATLSELGLSHRAHHLPKQLSGGEQQRVAIARAIVHRPEIVFADEPTGNLDSATGRSILELLAKTRRARGVTLVVVTHDASVASLADRVVAMESGRILSHARPAGG